MKSEYLTHRKVELIHEIDTCLNFIKANPGESEFYIDRAKENIVEFLRLDLELIKETIEETKNDVLANVMAGARV